MIIVLSIPLLSGSVEPNKFYGFRTSKTLSSPAIWYRANRLAAVYSIVGSLISIAGVLVLSIWKGHWGVEKLLTWSVMINVVPLLAAILIAALQVRRM